MRDWSPCVWVAHCLLGREKVPAPYLLFQCPHPRPGPSLFRFLFHRVAPIAPKSFSPPPRVRFCFAPVCFSSLHMQWLHAAAPRPQLFISFSFLFFFSSLFGIDKKCATYCVALLCSCAAAAQRTIMPFFLLPSFERKVCYTLVSLFAPKRQTERGGGTAVRGGGGGGGAAAAPLSRRRQPRKPN